MRPWLMWSRAHSMWLRVFKVLPHTAPMQCAVCRKTIGATRKIHLCAGLAGVGYGWMLQ